MIGKGIGGGMLSLAVREAWEIKGTQRVWLHTCSDDHPHALGNYEKRGFRLVQDRGNIMAALILTAFGGTKNPNLKSPTRCVGFKF